jgi:hypothetical protein
MGAVSDPAYIGQGSHTNTFVNQLCYPRHYTHIYLNALYSCGLSFPQAATYRWLVTADSPGGLPTNLQSVRHIHHGVYPASRDIAPATESLMRGRLTAHQCGGSANGDDLGSLFSNNLMMPRMSLALTCDSSISCGVTSNGEVLYNANIASHKSHISETACILVLRY